MKDIFSIVETVRISYEIRYNEDEFGTMEEVVAIINELYNGDPWHAENMCEDIYEIVYNQIDEYIESDLTTMEFYE
jgi:DNA-binding GntR family transcriptional regulator